jgi:tRNA pseudouridine(38-40) synthase
VQALGNVFAISTSSHPQEVIAGLTARRRGIWLCTYAQVPAKFNPRWASERWYRYRFPGILRLQEGAEILLSVGELRAFQNGASRSPPRIKSIELSRHGERIALDIRATHFVRNMVRRIAAGLQLFAQGTL